MYSRCQSCTRQINLQDSYCQYCGTELIRQRIVIHEWETEVLGDPNKGRFYSYLLPSSFGGKPNILKSIVYTVYMNPWATLGFIVLALLKILWEMMWAMLEAL